MNTTNYNMQRPCFVKVGDMVQSKNDKRFFGYVTFIEANNYGDYTVEVVYDLDADPVYFYDDELIPHKIIKE